MIESIDSFYHPSVKGWLEDGGDLTVNGQSFAGTKPKPIERHGAHVFEHHFKLSHQWAKIAVRVMKQDPVAEVFATMGYGDTGISTPTFSRSGVTIRETVNKSAINLDEIRGNALHGQGSTSASWIIDFRNPRIHAKKGLRESRYVPQDGNQTGANWNYMQYSTPVSSHTLPWWREQLYPHARYGGRFVHPVGATVTEAEYPKMVLQDGAHIHRDTPTWINYTHPREPWRDRADMRTADDQHISVYDALCEVYTAFPHDEALRWEVIFCARRFLFQIPGEDKGTFQWDPGQARARGRIPKLAAKLVPALIAAGEDDLAAEVGIRCAQRLGSQVKLWILQMKAGHVVWPYFEGWGKHSPAEIGIWWWGLDHAERLFASRGIDFLGAELRYMMDRIARFCFDAFYLSDQGVLDLDYYVTAKWEKSRRRDDLLRTGSGGDHLAWLAARNAIPSGQAEEAKMDALIAVGETMEKRWTGGMA